MIVKYKFNDKEYEQKIELKYQLPKNSAQQDTEKVQESQLNTPHSTQKTHQSTTTDTTSNSIKDTSKTQTNKNLMNPDSSSSDQTNINNSSSSSSNQQINPTTPEINKQIKVHQLMEQLNLIPEHKLKTLRFNKLLQKNLILKHRLKTQRKSLLHQKKWKINSIIYLFDLMIKKKSQLKNLKN
ncbi:hypothetical protein NWP96_02815 [Mycoplasmopsis cynos]|nr:hypothetical protein [Mycoplasmopsis cynos]